MSCSNTSSHMQVLCEYAAQKMRAKCYQQKEIALNLWAERRKSQTPGEDARDDGHDDDTASPKHASNTMGAEDTGCTQGNPTRQSRVLFYGLIMKSTQSNLKCKFLSKIYFVFIRSEPTSRVPRAHHSSLHNIQTNTVYGVRSRELGGGARSSVLELD